MRITQEADYALRMVCLLAAEETTAERTIGAPTLAETVAVPAGFANKILRKLSGAEIIRSTRGITGGYYLAADPATLTVRQIIETIDGPIEISRCLSEGHICQNNPRKTCCRFHHVFAHLNGMLTERLDRLTVATMVDTDRDIPALLSLIQ